MLAIPRLKLRLRGAVEKLQEEKAFVDNWPPERNYLFFLAKYTLINYAATVNIHYSENCVQNLGLLSALSRERACLQVHSIKLLVLGCWELSHVIFLKLRKKELPAKLS